MTIEWTGTRCHDASGKILGRIQSDFARNEWSAFVGGECLGSFIFERQAKAAVQAKLTGGSVTIKLTRHPETNEVVRAAPDEKHVFWPNSYAADNERQLG